MMNESDFPLNHARLGFFGKGGAGKSTVLVLMAHALARRGYDVVVLDADSTNVGLHRALGIATPPAALLYYFGGMIFSGGLITCPVDDPALLAGAALDLDHLSTRYYHCTNNGIVFMVAGKLAGQGPGAGCDGPLVKIARDLTVRRGRQPVLLVDFKAGFEDTARGAITTLDYAVVVVDPTLAGLQMAVHMRDMVEEIQHGGLPATRHLERPELVQIANQFYRQARIDELFVVLNKVGDAATEAYMLVELASAGITPLGTVHDDPGLLQAWLRGEPLRAEGSPSALEVDGLLAAIEAHLVEARLPDAAAA